MLWNPRARALHEITICVFKIVKIVIGEHLFTEILLDIAGNALSSRTWRFGSEAVG